MQKKRQKEGQKKAAQIWVQIKDYYTDSGHRLAAHWTAHSDADIHLLTGVGQKSLALKQRSAVDLTFDFVAIVEAAASVAFACSCSCSCHCIARWVPRMN